MGCARSWHEEGGAILRSGKTTSTCSVYCSIGYCTCSGPSLALFARARSTTRTSVYGGEPSVARPLTHREMLTRKGLSFVGRSRDAELGGSEPSRPSYRLSRVQCKP